MRILLIDQDCDRREEWAARIENEGVAITSLPGFKKSEFEAADAFEGVAGVIFAWADADDWLDEAKSLLEHRSNACEWIACLIDGEHSDVAQEAYALGFDDCLVGEVCDNEMSAKLEHVKHVYELNQRLAAAQKLEAIGELAAGIAHEINTPIQYVGDNTRFLQSSYDDLEGVLVMCQELIKVDDEKGDIAKVVENLRDAMDVADVDYLQEEVPSAITQTLEGIDRVTRIVRAMKEFAHPGNSEMTLTDLAKSIENTVTVARNEWKYVADLEVCLDSDLPNIPCLPGELNQVLLNIIVNAAHAIGDFLGDSPEKKGTIRITTRNAPPFAEIRISDTGGGIAQENIAKIFNPFFTTKAAGKGTGQGLAIARSVIVDKHGGAIDVESTVGEGTTFVVRLPLESSSNVEEPVALASATS